MDLKEQMPQYQLFIENLPLRQTINSVGDELFDIVVPTLVTRHDVKSIKSPSKLKVPEWAIDTCYSGEALTSPQFLAKHYQLFPAMDGMATNTLPQEKYLAFNGFMNITSPGSKSVSFQLYRAKIWLFSNLQQFADRPYPITLQGGGGIALKDGYPRTLLGRGALMGSGLKIQIEFASKTPNLSVWIPT
jgi:hypothetical protein